MTNVGLVVHVVATLCPAQVSVVFSSICDITLCEELTFLENLFIYTAFTFFCGLSVAQR